MPRYDDYLFYAEVQKGHVIKVLIDIFSGQIPRTVFHVTQEGIKILDTDDKFTVCYNTFLERENFRAFHNERDFSFSFNLKHVNKLIRTVKKKDSVIFFIRNDDITNMVIQIALQSGSLETNVVTVQEELEGYHDELPDKSEYHHPIAIQSSDFQKIKKQTVNGKVIHVKMIRNDYLCFSSGSGDIYSSKLEFGSLEGIEDDGEDIYEVEFSSSMFSNLVKLPGLSPQLQFYCPPKDKQYPLLIRTNVGTQGKLEIFIKDKELISLESDD